MGSLLLQLFIFKTNLLGTLPAVVVQGWIGEIKTQLLPNWEASSIYIAINSSERNILSY